MGFLQKIQKWVEAINTYYAFAVIVYPLILFATQHSQVFLWIFAITTPLLAAWSGFLFKSFLERRHERHGFRTISDEMTYEIEGRHHATLRFHTTLKAATDYLMVYPIGYQWTGDGEEAVPKVTGKNQALLAHVAPHNKKLGALKMIPYETDSVSADAGWHYWFIALNPPVYKGDIVEIKYEQEFQDKKKRAKPYIGYFVRTPLKQLRLNVRFPEKMPTQIVSAVFFKPSDPNHPIILQGIDYDPDKQWATLVIEKPKKGCYRIQWQEAKM